MAAAVALRPCVDSPLRRHCSILRDSVLQSIHTRDSLGHCSSVCTQPAIQFYFLPYSIWIEKQRTGEHRYTPRCCNTCVGALRYVSVSTVGDIRKHPVSFVGQLCDVFATHHHVSELRSLSLNSAAIALPSVWYIWGFAHIQAFSSFRAISLPVEYNELRHLRYAVAAPGSFENPHKSTHRYAGTPS